MAGNRAYVHRVSESGTGEPPVAVAQLARADVPDAAQVLARAFRDDPISSWLLPDPVSREGRLRRYFTTLMRRQVLSLGRGAVSRQRGNSGRPGLSGDDVMARCVTCI